MRNRNCKDWSQRNRKPPRKKLLKKNSEAGFHWSRSRSRSRSRSQSRKSASDLVKIKIRSRKWSHKLDGVGVGRINGSIFFRFRLDSDAYDPVKTRLSELQAGSVKTNQSQCQFSGILIGVFFGFRLRLQQPSFH